MTFAPLSTHIHIFSPSSHQANHLYPIAPVTVKMSPAQLNKRIILCCDGTWMSSIGEKGADPPSNVTRIARVLRRNCLDGKPQIIFYDSGVGSSSSTVDKILGGAFGMGLDENIREAYNFICTNYIDGDEIILVGFSRGAFTARSVADMIGSIGLLTADGLDQFYAIFNDYENIGDTKRSLSKYLCNLEPYEDQHDDSKAAWIKKRKEDYVTWLKCTDGKPLYTRDHYVGHAQPGQNKEPAKHDIKIKAIAVFDTVGTLGIPPAPILGIRGSADQWKFTNTQISSKVENAFQALALDEPRFAFRPALWEQPDKKRANLKQVWFPGNHGGIGGGWYDQQIADITLAWMCDQLSSVGVEFDYDRLHGTFMKTLEYSVAHPLPMVPPQIPLLTPHYAKQHLPLPSWTTYLWQRKPIPWAIAHLCPPPPTTPRRDPKDCLQPHHRNCDLTLGPNRGVGPRPWGLGQIRYPPSFFQCFVGSWVRTPGMTLRVDPDTNADIPNQELVGTSERIHSCVRVRLAARGLGLDDLAEWKCEALTGNPTNGARWRLERGSGFKRGEGGNVGAAPEVGGGRSDVYPADKLYQVESGDSDWKWVFQKAEGRSRNHREPGVTVIPEEPLTGYWERHLLALTCGKTDVWRWAQDNPPSEFSVDESA
ncbi:peptidoglycan binding domain-containing protein [Lasiosphaeria hispida]|uniref:Peptidoglycan binding domain-containing protein n=1 Tax=Lasiosphaeria hispida TaxID=260671 RepID=A0AAJ0MFE9_9PEZI|nr:peptidoglycan binding domain-containing protein [Lasiosphaeria hispida]